MASSLCSSGAEGARVCLHVSSTLLLVLYLFCTDSYADVGDRTCLLCYFCFSFCLLRWIKSGLRERFVADSRFWRRYSGDREHLQLASRWVTEETLMSRRKGSLDSFDEHTHAQVDTRDTGISQLHQDLTRSAGGSTREGEQGTEASAWCARGGSLFSFFRDGKNSR